MEKAVRRPKVQIVTAPQQNQLHTVTSLRILSGRNSALDAGNFLTRAPPGGVQRKVFGAVAGGPLSERQDLPAVSGKITRLPARILGLSDLNASCPDAASAGEAAVAKWGQALLLLWPVAKRP